MPSALVETLLLNSSHSSLPRSKIPAFLYGCAWKKERTADLVYQALNTGFTGIDVAAQPRHYREDLAGAGIRRAFAEGKLQREDLFVQTKYTSIAGQDPSNLPYDPKSSITEQVRTSVASSLRNLTHSENTFDHPPYIDCLVLHSPLPTFEQTMEAWRAFEEFVPGSIRNLGISNTSLPLLEALFDTAKIKPAVVQNRFHRETLFEVPLRAFCRKNGIIFQSFWTLTANPRLIRSSPVEWLAKAANVDPMISFYCLVLALQDTIILNGTQNHMKSDLEGHRTVSDWASKNAFEFENNLKQFKTLIGDTNFGTS